MTDRLDAITAGMANGGIDYPTYADLEWLVDEVRRRRQRHAEAVEAAFREGWDDAHGYQNYGPEPTSVDEAWLMSEARKRG